MIVIKNKKNCCGCSACANICPQKCIILVEDNEGFVYPQIDKEKCINCGACTNVCPIINATKDDGAKPKSYGAFSLNEEVLKNSSSGGVFYHLATYVMQKLNGVIYGACYVDNRTKHISIDKVEDLRKLQTSKYIQSDMSDSFACAKKDLTDGKYVLFSGTPCQIEGLKHYLRKDYEKLFCIDIICHGVPSSKLWQKYLDFCEQNTNAEVNFRDKQNGWLNYGVRIGKQVRAFKNDLFMQSFLRDYNLRPSCYDCKFKKIHRVSDITLGDFWGGDNVSKTIFNKNGTSLVLIQSNKGTKLFDGICDEIKTEKVDFNASIKYNASYFVSSIKPIGRNKFFKKADILPFDNLVAQYCKVKLIDRVFRKVKNIIKCKQKLK